MIPRALIAYALLSTLSATASARIHQHLFGAHPSTTCAFELGGRAFDLCPLLERGIDHWEGAGLLSAEGIAEWDDAHDDAPLVLVSGPARIRLVHGRVFGLAEDEVSSFADNDEEEEGKGKGNEEDKGNEEEGEEGEENDLVDIAPGSSRPRRVIGTVLLLTAIALLLLAYLVRYPPPFLQRLASSPILTLKRLSPPRILNRLNAIGPFRVREARLVRWAQEDMGLLGGELGEEDVMVNGADAGDELDIDGGKGMGKGKGGGVGKGEQIPLKPTPWAGVRGYGTAAR